MYTPLLMYSINMDLTIIGIAGSTLVLLAFLLNQLNKLKNNSFFYDFINFLGSVFLLIYAIYTNSLPFIIVNMVWGLFSLKDCLMYLLKRKS